MCMTDKASAMSFEAYRFETFYSEGQVSTALMLKRFIPDFFLYAITLVFPMFIFIL